MQKLFAAVACICLLMSFASAQHINPSPMADEAWKDDQDNFINAHGAGILYFGDTYYLFGEIKKGKTNLVPGQDWEDYRVPAGGVACYRSKDLKNWKYEGIVLAATSSDPESDLDTGRVIERPKVIYNVKTRKFVMWLHIDKPDYSFARAGVAVSDRPEGPYQYLGSLRPNGQESRDMTLFRDDDDKAYLIYASERNNTMHICLLSEDYLRPTILYNRILIDQRREAPALFKFSGKYFLITSLCSGWSPNAALYSVADSLMGNWQNRGNPCSGPGADSSFASQSTFVLPLNEMEGSFLFMADRWNKTDLSDSRYLWIPFQVEGENSKIQIREFGTTGH
jgi:Glycosyl hydrolases family 43